MTQPGSAPSRPGGWEELDLAYRDPLQLEHMSLRDLHRARDGVFIEQDARVDSRAFRPPAFHDKLTPEGLCSFEGRGPVSLPPVFIAKRSDVLLTGTRGIVDRSGGFHFDESLDFAPDRQLILENLDSGQHFHNQWMGFRREPATGAYRLAPADEIIEIDVPVVLLTSREGPNYGAFIFRTLPKILQLAHLDPTIKVLVPLEDRSFANMLAAAGVHPSRIIRHAFYRSYALREVYVPSLRNWPIWLDVESCALFRFMRMKYGAPRSGRRIYISRRHMKSSTRVMRNELELAFALTDMGFETVFPERLSAVEQIETFSAADVVVGASGSALFNCVFCYPGTKLIDIESERHWIEGHAGLFSSTGMDYGIFEAEAADKSGTPHVPFTVDIARLERRLKDFIGE